MFTTVVSTKLQLDRYDGIREEKTHSMRSLTDTDMERKQDCRPDGCRILNKHHHK